MVTVLQRENGGMLEEIMEQMDWQKHTVGGFHGRRDEEGRIRDAIVHCRTEVEAQEVRAAIAARLQE